MVSKTFRIVLFFVILASISYGCTAANSQLQDSSSGASLSGPQAAQQAIAPALTECNNIALGKAADASSNSPQAGLAVDGSAATLWNATAYVPQWIEINLGSLNSIDEIRLNVAQSPAGDTTHQIWVADSSKVYTQVDTITGPTADGQLLDRVYSPSLTSVQWIKIMTTAGPSWVAWREIQVCQTPATTSTPTSTPTDTPTSTPTFTPTNTPVLAACDNIALGKTTNASANPAQSGLAVDNNMGTLWNALNYVPQWIEIDLGGLHSIDELRLYVAQSPSGDTTHQVWVADASKAYQQVDTITGFTSNGQLLDRVYNPSLTSVQWIKIMTTAGPSWVAWLEIQVCQTPASGGTATSTPTGTSTATPTNTPVNGPTSTSTSTPTNTPAGGQTNTPTSTPTNTPSTGPTSTPTQEPEDTETPTPTAVSNTPGKITGGGDIEVGNGAKGTFGFVVSYDQGDSAPKGNLNFVDHATGMHLKSTDLDSLIVQGTHAWFSGMATIDNGQEVSFKVEVRDLGEPGTSDWFRIVIPDLNYEASGTLTSGNIQIHKK